MLFDNLNSNEMHLHAYLFFLQYDWVRKYYNDRTLKAFAVNPIILNQRIKRYDEGYVSDTRNDIEAPPDELSVIEDSSQTGITDL